MMKKFIAIGFCLILVVMMVASFTSYADEGKDYTVEYHVTDISMRCEVEDDWILVVENQSKSTAANIIVTVSCGSYSERFSRFDLPGFSLKRIDLTQCFSKEALESNTVKINVTGSSWEHHIKNVILIIVVTFCLFVVICGIGLYVTRKK